MKKTKTKPKRKKAMTCALPCDQDPNDPRYWLAQYHEAHEAVQDMYVGIGRLLEFDQESAEDILRVRDFVKGMRALAEFARLVGLSNTNGWGLTLDEQRVAWDVWYAEFEHAAAAAIPQ